MLFRYLTHPQVKVDPAIPVPEWGLSDVGAARIAKLAQSAALEGAARVIASSEVKAVEAAKPLASALGCEVEVRPRMGENDRSSTGFLPPDAFEQMADRFFGEPETSAEGWERAIDAQARVVSEVDEVLRDHREGDILFVGHGAVGTLLYCAWAGAPIARSYDQPHGGGNYFTADIKTRAALHHWRPLEALLDEA